MEMKDRGAGKIGWWLMVPLVAASLAASPQQRTGELLEPGQFLEVPFPDGERLRYEVNWKPLFLVPAFKAGELVFTVEQSLYLDRPTYTISAQASSEGPLSSIAGLEIRDYFESNIDRRTLRSYRFMRQIRQNKRKRDLEVLFDYDRDTFWVSEVNLEGELPKTTRDQTLRGLPGPVADILSVFYVARMRSLSPGDRYLIHLGDNIRIKQVEVRVEEEEKVTTRLAEFETVRVSTVGGFFKKGKEFRIWYSTQGDHFPVKFEADVKLGKVYGEVIEHTTPRISRSIIQVD